MIVNMKLNEDENKTMYKENFLLPREHLMSLSIMKKEHAKFLDKMENSVWKKIK